jgi:hypothetical protein
MDARVRCRGSELLLAGMPREVPSTRAWMLFVHRAATSGLSTVVTRTWRTSSFVRKSFCWSERSKGRAPLASYGFPP